jgi:ribosomal protein L16 Arg81 hydroxylase
MLKTFDELLDPISTAEFARTCWQRRSLYVPGPASKVRGLFATEKFRALAAAVEAGRGVLKAGFKDPSGEHTEIGIQASQIETAVHAGMTVLVDQLDALDAPLRRLADHTKVSLGLPGAVSVGAFLSPVGSGFGLHFDPVSNWIIQVEGVKRWRYSSTPALDFPQGTFVPDARQRHAGVYGLGATSLEECELTPGDVLYLPAGAWHEPKAVGGPSLHLSMIAHNASMLSLLNEARGRSKTPPGSPMPGSAAWRWLPSAPLLGQSEADDRGAVERELAHRRDVIVEELQRLSATELYDLWRSKARAAGRRPSTPRRRRARA